MEDSDMCVECQTTCNAATSNTINSTHAGCQYCRANCRVECISVANGPKLQVEHKKKAGE